MFFSCNIILETTRIIGNLLLNILTEIYSFIHSDYLKCIADIMKQDIVLPTIPNNYSWPFLFPSGMQQLLDVKHA